MVEINGGVVKATEIGNDRIVGEVHDPARFDRRGARPGPGGIVTYETPEADRKLADRELVWLTTLEAKGTISTGFNWGFFTTGDSREAELAGILGALVGSASRCW